jgi:formate dehydrogenase alpha subunit
MIDLNPFIERDVSKCIRCGRCIRADQEIAVVGAIDYVDRGFDSRPATLLDQPLEKTDCNFCGICVSVCPTGALMEKNRASTLSATHATKSVCTLCQTGCQIKLLHRGNRIVGVAPAMDEESVNHVSLCAKGHFGIDYVHSKARIKTPLIRKDGELVEATWDEAMTLVAKRFGEIRTEKSGAALGAIGASHGTNEENYLLQKLVRQGFASNNIDSGGRLRGAKLSAGIENVLGTGAMTNPIDHVVQADEILVIGADPLVESPILGQKIKQAVRLGSAHLTQVTKLPAGLSYFAQTWLRPNPGTSVLFLAGLVHEIVGRGCPESVLESIDPEWLVTLRSFLGRYSPDVVEEATGIPQKHLKQTASRILASSKLAVIAGTELAADPNAYDAGLLLGALIQLTGNVDKDGCGLFPIAGSFNDRGTGDMAGGFDLTQKGADYPGMITACAENKIAGLLVVGEDPATAFPGRKPVNVAFAQLEFLVVQDLFLTDTAKLAHVVLPSCSIAEKSGTWTSIERRVEPLAQAIEPLFDSRPDWVILTDMLNRMGVLADYDSPNDILQAINETVPGYAGVTAKHLLRESVFVPCAYEESRGNVVFPATDSPGKIDSNLPESIAPKFDPKFPFTLVLAGSLFQSADRKLTEHSKVLQKATNGTRIWINEIDAAPLGLDPNGRAVLVSAKYSVPVHLAVSPTTPRGIIIAHPAPDFNPLDLFTNELGKNDGGAFGRDQTKVRVEADHG